MRGCARSAWSLNKDHCYLLCIAFVLKTNMQIPSYNSLLPLLVHLTSLIHLRSAFRLIEGMKES